MIIITRTYCVIEQDQTIIKHPQRQPLHVGQERWRAHAVVRQGGGAQAPRHESLPHGTIVNDNERFVNNYQCEHTQAESRPVTEPSWQGSQRLAVPSTALTEAPRRTDTTATHTPETYDSCSGAHLPLQPKQISMMSMPQKCSSQALVHLQTARIR